MQTRVKTTTEIEAMREGGAMLSAVLTLLERKVVVGMTTKQLADIASAELKALGGKPAFLGYSGFPDVICISVNDEVVHGIPGKRVICDGDIVGMDFGVKHRGMITDAARSVIVGVANKSKQHLVDQTRWSLDAGIAELRDGVRVGTIASAIQSVLDKAGLGIVRDLVGHGVGHELHEEPNIPNYGRANTGFALRAGMTIAIEPMTTLGSHKVYMADDGWTIATRDGSLSAHFEHTVLITEQGAEILTA